MLAARDSWPPTTDGGIQVRVRDSPSGAADRPGRALFLESQQLGNMWLSKTGIFTVKQLLTSQSR